jgi:methionyl-tRNA formyltransferase
MKIIFMGTPEFSLPTLEALHQEHQVVAVYTQAPKPAGRGQAEKLSPIHKLANQLNLSVFTPKTLRNLDAQAELAALKADCAVVVAYGLILPKEVIASFAYGCINIHPSLLPKYRGAAPMQRTILAGEKETAMCIMQMDEGIDTGDILLMEKISLNDDISYPELSDNMAKLGAELLLQVLKNIDQIVPQKQSETGACYAKKITKEEAELNWNEDAAQLMLKVRALNPWPGTFFNYNGEKIKVLAAKVDNLEHDYAPGAVIDSKSLIVACANGVFQPTMLQRPGKGPVATNDFLRGYKINSLVS